MFIEMNKIRQLANTLIYQDILQLTWKSSYWRKYINLMLFIEKRGNIFKFKTLIWLERDSMGRGEHLSQKLQVIFFWYAILIESTFMLLTSYPDQKESN